MPHLPARSLVLLALAFAASFSAGCATTDRAATEGRNALTIRGDFGELDVQGALTVGEEATIVLSPSKADGQPFAALAFHGEAGTFVKVEVTRDGAGEAVGADVAASPEVILLAAQGASSATVVSHGHAPNRSTLWFKLLRGGTHYVVAKDADAAAQVGRRARVRVTEVLAPVARL
ncbi:MAG: hypothetical protein U0235_13775 [Polyangiaceae bacterium]